MFISKAQIACFELALQNFELLDHRELMGLTEINIYQHFALCSLYNYLITNATDKNKNNQVCAYSIFDKIP
jgi:hypothetical protein